MASNDVYIDLPEPTSRKLAEGTNDQDCAVVSAAGCVRDERFLALRMGDPFHGMVSTRSTAVGN